VTGAASGLGAAIAEAYVAEGATVIVADVAVAAGQAVADRLGQSAHYIELDISDEQRWQTAVDWIWRSLVVSTFLSTTRRSCVSGRCWDSH